MQKKLEIAYYEYSNMAELTVQQRSQLQEAYEVCKYSYSPYSKFPVGACILLNSGEFITGTNVENASYPCGICAERSALYSIPNHLKSAGIKSIAICCFNQNLGQLPSSPCGLCRQVLNEYEKNNNGSIQILLGHPHGKILYFENCQTILPFSFNSKDLISIKNNL